MIDNRTIYDYYGKLPRAKWKELPLEVIQEIAKHKGRRGNASWVAKIAQEMLIIRNGSCGYKHNTMNAHRTGHQNKWK